MNNIFINDKEHFKLDNYLDNLLKYNKSKEGLYTTL